MILFAATAWHFTKLTLQAKALTYYEWENRTCRYDWRGKKGPCQSQI